MYMAGDFTLDSNRGLRRYLGDSDTACVCLGGVGRGTFLFVDEGGVEGEEVLSSRYSRFFCFRRNTSC